MTTIAYRDGVMASDSLVTKGHSHRDGTSQKVYRLGPPGRGILVGIAGQWPAAQRLVDWLRAGAHGEPPDMGGEKGAEALIIMPDGLIVSVTWAGWERYRAEYVTLGCGSDYASGAMAHGATAEEAVAASLVHESASGGPIQVVHR